MSINLELPEVTELKPRLTVIGVGGAGGNAINNMIASGLDGVDFVVANTDAQALAMSSAEHTIQLGRHLTEGLGAGSKPEIGEAAAEEAIDEIKSIVAGSHMVFVAAGMGGGTGTGAASVIARAAKDQGILTVGVVTRPFQFEGARRMRIANAGIEEIRKHVDTLIVIPNQNLFRVANERTTFAEAFVMADQVLHSGVACITDLIVREGLINLDFADVKTVMSNMGTAMMGTGEASGERRAIEAAEEAIANPLLSEISMKGAKGLLVSITGGDNLTLYEVDQAASRVREEVDPEANIIVGATFDATLDESLRVSIVASGIGPASATAAEPNLGRGVAAEPGVVPVLSKAPGGKVATPASAATPAGMAPTPPSPVPASAIAPRQQEGVVNSAAVQRQAPPTGMAPKPAQRSGAPSSNPAPNPAPAPAPAQGTAAQSKPIAPPQHPVQRNQRADAAMTPPAARMPAKQSAAPGRAASVAGAPTNAAPRGLVDQISAVMNEEAHAFTPQPPVQVKRAPVKMPRVEDFPEVGQKAYSASQNAGQPAVQEPSPAAKKAGFLRRLTGRGGKAAETNHREAIRAVEPDFEGHEMLPQEPDLVQSNTNLDGGKAVTGGDATMHNGVTIEPFSGHAERGQEQDIPRLFRKNGG